MHSICTATILGLQELVHETSLEKMFGGLSKNIKYRRVVQLKISIVGAAQLIFIGGSPQSN